jgi:hypothetical protein
MYLELQVPRYYLRKTGTCRRSGRIIDGFVAVTQGAVELTGENLMLLAVVFHLKASCTSQSISNDSSSSVSLRKKGRVTQIFSSPSPPAAHIVLAEA